MKFIYYGISADENAYFFTGNDYLQIVFIRPQYFVSDEPARRIREW